jgi:hypothetical protein
MTLVFNSHFKQVLVGQLQWIITENAKYLEQIKNENQFFIDLIKPKNLNASDPDNEIYKAKKDFEKLCVLLETNGISKPEKLNVFRFFTTIRHFETRKPPKQNKR